MRNVNLFAALFAAMASIACEPARIGTTDFTIDPDGGIVINTPDGGSNATPDGGGSTACNMDGVKNGGEIDIDCGFSCGAKCATGKACVRFDDCQTGRCEANVCKDAPTPGGPTCSDGARNGGETDVDCGGTCAAKCGLNLGCAVDSDCTSSFCSFGRCAVKPADATCADGAKNGTESDVDCGKDCTTSKCANGKACIYSADCQTGICEGGFCRAPTGPTPICNRNNAKDGNETGVDCGGSECGPCANGQQCLRSTDCSSATCDNGTCVGSTSSPTPSCSNSVRDGNESDVDCGGSCAARCGTGLACVYASDCASNLVCNSGRCATNGGTTPTPSQPCNNNGIKDGDETDVDCGGGAYDNSGILVSGCGTCAKDKKCLKYTDCQSRICSVAAGNTCVGESLTGPAPTVDTTERSGTFLVNAQASIPAACGVVRIDWTCEKPCTQLRIKKGWNGTLDANWATLPAPSGDGLSGTFQVSGVNNPGGFTFRLEGHTNTTGENGESRTGVIQVSECLPNGEGSTVNGMGVAGAWCGSLRDCASKTCNNGRCGVVSSSPYGLNFALETITFGASLPGPVDITAELPRGSTPSTAGSTTRSITISIPDLCDPSIQGVNGPNEFLRYSGNVAGRGSGTSLVQLRLPGDGGIVLGVASSRGDEWRAISRAQLKCEWYGFPP